MASGDVAVLTLLTATSSTRLHRSNDPLRLPARPSPERDVRVAIPTNRASLVAHRPVSDMPSPLPRWTGCVCRLPSPSVGAFPVLVAGRRSHRPARRSLALRPAGSLSCPRQPLSRGFGPADCSTAPLVSFRAQSTLARLVPSSHEVDSRLQGAHQHSCHQGPIRSADRQPRRHIQLKTAVRVDVLPD